MPSRYTQHVAVGFLPSSGLLQSMSIFILGLVNSLGRGIADVLTVQGPLFPKIGKRFCWGFVVWVHHLTGEKVIDAVGN